MKKVNVGILGCARIVEKYAIDAFLSLPNVELVAIASRNADKAALWAARYGLEAETYESLIARADIDVIYSPLPVGLQEEWLLKAAAAKKHSICEKSISYSLESARRMVNVCQSAGVALYENFVPEFHPQHARVLSLIGEGAIGTPHVWSGVYGIPHLPNDDIRYRADLKEGALNDLGCYLVFMARKIMQQEPIAVTCALTWNGHDVDTDGSAMLEFERGTALMSFGFDRVYQNTYSVWGSNGMISTNRAFAVPPTFVPNVELVTNNGMNEKREMITILPANQFALSFEFFCDAVARRDEEMFSDMYDRIIHQARILDAMRLSARESMRIAL